MNQQFPLNFEADKGCKLEGGTDGNNRTMAQFVLKSILADRELHEEFHNQTAAILQPTQTTVVTTHKGRISFKNPPMKINLIKK